MQTLALMSQKGGAGKSTLALHLAAKGASRAEGYGLVVLDTAPSADRASVQAAEAADLILIPCRPVTFDLDAITATRAA